ncbi:uncharacterized mitochondrial protein AtMg00810-like [Aristolochia californica]|uniref:uncharacterized mitochondrial protein AtMg00810-like n=1 Tax=Aristolochia californica TaxID=171875 RepID=UPI0035E35105
MLLREQLATKFEMKNLGRLKYFLGIEVARSKQGIILFQGKYILDLLFEVGLLELTVISQFMHCPSEDNMNAMNQILRYLKSSPGKGLMFLRNNHLRVEGYTDAD